MKLIEVDGSYGEGGGQILRTSIVLSAILGIGVVIKNIRKNRPRPGLAMQHIKSIILARELSNAKVDGLAPGSTQVTFMPGKISGGDYFLDVGTAGSISLVLQSVMPIAAYAPSPVTFEIVGGTDVKWSPPYDYLENVTLPALRRFGYKADISLLHRGYYPRGMGRIKMTVYPSSLHGADLIEKEYPYVRGVSSSSRLPAHVAERQASAAREYIESRGISVDEIKLDIRLDESTGSSITLFKGFLGRQGAWRKGDFSGKGRYGSCFKII